MQQSIHHPLGCDARTCRMRQQSRGRSMPQRCAQPAGPVLQACVSRRCGKRANPAKGVLSAAGRRHEMLCRASGASGGGEVRIVACALFEYITHTRWSSSRMRCMRLHLIWRMHAGRSASCGIIIVLCKFRPWCWWVTSGAPTADWCWSA